MPNLIHTHICKRICNPQICKSGPIFGNSCTTQSTLIGSSRYRFIAKKDYPRPLRESIGHKHMYAFHTIRHTPTGKICPQILHTISLIQVVLVRRLIISLQLRISMEALSHVLHKMGRFHAGSLCH